MRLGVLAFSILFAFLGYCTATDYYGVDHVIGVYVGLATGVLVLAFLSFWLMENDPQLRASEKFARKNRRW